MLLTDIEAAIKPDDAHFARSRLLALENTWGGQVLPLSYIEDATELARKRGLATHLRRASNTVARATLPPRMAGGSLPARWPPRPIASRGAWSAGRGSKRS